VTTPLVGPLLDALAQIPTDEPALAAEIDTIRNRLSEPLRVVLAGRVSTGKSTLLNGLLGQAVAPTDYSECTQAVTWFRYGFQQKVEVRLRDGSTKELNLSVDGRLPRQLGVEISEIQDVQVSLANEALRSFTLVDTPGFSSGRASGGAEGKELAAAMDRRSRQAAAACDAMIFVLNGTLRADELDVLNAFQDAQHGPASAVNAIGALTKADQLGDGDEDPLEVAAGLAKRYAQRHAKDVSDVVPVVGLFAETAEAGLLTERDVANLALLSGLDAEAQTDLLASVDDFRDERCTVVGEFRWWPRQAR
jgi:GTP-binding protein EngB required for normal cell division